MTIVASPIERIESDGLALDGVTLTTTGLEITGEIDFEKWEAVGATLKHINGAIQWWVGDWLNYGERAYGEKYAQAMDATDYEYQGLNGARWVAKEIEFVRRRTNVPFSHHKEVAALPVAQQEQLLSWASSEIDADNKVPLREFRKKATEAKRLLATPRSFPAGTYRVIYADPPWQYADERTATVAGGGAIATYPTMPLEEICALADPSGRAIREMAQPDCVCFLWATSPLLKEGLHVLESWGFTYKASYVWDKIRGYNGHYNDVRHEFLLIGTKGSCLPDSQELNDSVVAVEKSAHSAKPDEFYYLIEGMYKRGPYLELFARRRRNGWESWGNQAKEN